MYFLNRVAQLTSTSKR